MLKDTMSMLLITTILYATLPLPVAVCQMFCLFVIFVKEIESDEK